MKKVNQFPLVGFIFLINSQKWIQVLTTAYRRGAVRLVSGRMSRRVPSAAAAGAVCRRGPVRLLTGPWDAAAGIARRRAGGRPVPRRGPPVA